MAPMIPSIQSQSQSQATHQTMHIAVLPWLAVGHLTPFLELSKRLVRLGHRVSFLSTPNNNRRLAKLNPDLSSSIQFVNLFMPRTEGLPGAGEVTTELEPAAHAYLKKAFDGLEPAVANFLQQESPPTDWIIYDYAPYWVPRVAARSGTRCAFLALLNAAANTFLGPPSALMDGEGSPSSPHHLAMPPPWIPFPTSVAYRPHEALQIFTGAFKPDASGVSESYRLGASAEGCDVMAVRTCSEFESEWLQVLERIHQQPVLPVGHFPTSVQVGVCNFEWQWLDDQDVGSVVYVAFGSEVRFSKEQVHEIALGLELSELPFLWALRSSAEMLPDGFEDRTVCRGLVCKGWLPQLQIMRHPSVGGFLTHCGWNSLVEALQFGLALVLLPMMTDQGLNARLMEEKKVGVEVPRKEDDGSFFSGDIARTIRLLMLEEEGHTCRARVKELKGTLGNEEVHDRYVRKFVDYLENNKCRQEDPSSKA